MFVYETVLGVTRAPPRVLMPGTRCKNGSFEVQLRLDSLQVELEFNNRTVCVHGEGKRVYFSFVFECEVVSVFFCVVLGLLKWGVVR